MTITIRQAAPEEIERLIPILVLAEGSERALRWSLEHLSDSVYRAERDGRVVGAATMRWESEPCEIVELAVAEAEQGTGVGRAIVAWLVEEGARRGKRAMLVGTANASLGNIAFYQKCGFRMDHVRKDYFRYQREPEYENGILVRDMLVFTHPLGDAPVAR